MKILGPSILFLCLSITSFSIFAGNYPMDHWKHISTVGLPEYENLTMLEKMHSIYRTMEHTLLVLEEVYKQDSDETMTQIMSLKQILYSLQRQSVDLLANLFIKTVYPDGKNLENPYFMKEYEGLERFHYYQDALILKDVSRKTLAEAKEKLNELLETDAPRASSKLSFNEASDITRKPLRKRDSYIDTNSNFFDEETYNDIIQNGFSISVASMNYLFENIKQNSSSR